MRTTLRTGRGHANLARLGAQSAPGAETGPGGLQRLIVPIGRTVEERFFYFPSSVGPGSLQTAEEVSQVFRGRCSAMDFVTGHWASGITLTPIGIVSIAPYLNSCSCPL